MNVGVTSLYDRRANDRWNRVSVGDVLERVTRCHPDKDAAIIACAGASADPEFARLTYREADEFANRVANALLQEGLERGQRVVLLCGNSVEALVSLFGIAKAGLVAAPINPKMAPDVLEALLDRLEPAFPIADEHWPHACAAFATANVELDVTIPIGEPAVDGSTGFADWVSERPTSEPEVEIHGGDVWELLFTSGTTSLPKAPMGTHTYSYLAAYSTAVVVFSPGDGPTESDIIDFTRARLAGYETPKQIILVDQMPTIVGGKIRKHKLRERFSTSS